MLRQPQRLYEPLRELPVARLESFDLQKLEAPVVVLNPEIHLVLENQLASGTSDLDYELAFPILDVAGALPPVQAHGRLRLEL